MRPAPTRDSHRAGASPGDASHRHRPARTASWCARGLHSGHVHMVGPGCCRCTLLSYRRHRRQPRLSSDPDPSQPGVPALARVPPRHCGTLALQGGPIEWIATHRVHHAKTDREGDPHNVHRGLRWAHIEWLYRSNDARPDEAEQKRLAPDLVRVPFYRFLERTYLFWQVGLGVLLFAIGGWPWVIWGIFVRVVLTYHVTWLSTARRTIAATARFAPTTCRLITGGLPC